jgi:prepilin-type N-terminal cleavage/methylation domain-containing protein
MKPIPHKQQKAFTLIEVLISIALLGIVIVALFSTVSMMRDSNAHLYKYLQKSKKITKATKVLYMDIMSSDGNISIKKDEFSRLCMQETRNSLYALSLAKVCWVVLKKENTLVRVEGNNYKLPTGFEDRVEVNPVMKHIELFDVYHQKDKVLVFLKQKGEKPITFMVQGITKPVVKKVKKKKATKKTPQRKKPSNIKPGQRANPQGAGNSPIKSTPNTPNVTQEG